MDLNGLRDFQQTLVVRGIAQGAVTAEKTVSVKFSGTTIKCRAGRGVTTATGDVVLAFRSGFELVVVERLHAAAPTGQPDDFNSYPDNPWASIQTGKTIIYPVETRSYREPDGWYKEHDDLMQGRWSGKNHSGCAFYGKKPRSLAGAEVTRAFIKVKRSTTSTWSGSAPTTLKLVTEKTRPSGAPTVGTSTDGPWLSRGEQENFVIPDSFAQDLVDGDSGGLAISVGAGTPLARLMGRHSWSPSFALTVEWRRVT